MGNLQTFQMEMTKAAFQLMVLEAIGFAVAMWLLYFVIKYAIRDGINESRLGDSWRARVTSESRKTHNGDTLPPMRAD